ncbi:hypothetical protein BpHYR1_024297 [Brachionus plicatilis]|uniref:Uncharacterized protein n=1 Tax=Brachionus plicatilis TaxID=10195 RepID=A0A3M7SD54_BRAPC|nr:hypothetical protein BpHYR1_024297 [Brachionus plicatilis]
MAGRCGRARRQISRRGQIVGVVAEIGRVGRLQQINILIGSVVSDADHGRISSGQLQSVYTLISVRILTTRLIGHHSVLDAKLMVHLVILALVEQSLHVLNLIFAKRLERRLSHVQLAAKLARIEQCSLVLLHAGHAQHIVRLGLDQSSSQTLGVQRIERFKIVLDHIVSSRLLALFDYALQVASAHKQNGQVHDYDD